MKRLIFCLLISTSLFAEAKIKVVTTLPDIAELVREIGAQEVEVQSLLTGNEDPHYADARPDYILKVNRADVICMIGLDLEDGWLAKVLTKSGNKKVQEGGSGYCVLGKAVKPLDIPSGTLNRSMGDIHAHGNPHFNLSPLKMAEAGAEVVRVLSAIQPDKASEFQKNYEAFSLRMNQLQNSLAKNLKNKKVMEYHKEFTYFFHTYNLDSVGSLEEKPGMPPSAARIGLVAKLAKENNVSVLLANPSAPHKVLERFQELSGVPVVIVPSYLQTTGKYPAKSIEDLQKLLVKSIP